MAFRMDSVGWMAMVVTCVGAGRACVRELQSQRKCTPLVFAMRLERTKHSGPRQKVEQVSTLEPNSMGGL